MSPPNQPLRHTAGRLPLLRLLTPPELPPECGHFFPARLPVPRRWEWVAPFLLTWALAAAGVAALTGWHWLAALAAGVVVIHAVVFAGSAVALGVAHRMAGTVTVHLLLALLGWLAWCGGGWMKTAALSAAGFWAANGLAWLWLRLRESVRGSVLLFAGLHLLPCAAGYIWGAGWAALAVLGLGAFLAWNTFLSGWSFGAAVPRFPTEKKEICLTIDDGPCADTEQMLALLAEHPGRAVFFLIGDSARQRPEDVQRIVAAGHMVGNHTQSHPAHWFWAYAPAAMHREIIRCEETLLPLCGYRPFLFRAPVGFYNPWCHAAAAEQQLKTVGWRGHSWDGICCDVDIILRRLRRGLRPGSILLMHQGRPHSLAVLRGLLEMLRREGWALTIPDAWEQALRR